LPALAHVLGVRQTLAHHVNEFHAAIHIKALISIRRETHVTRPQCHALSDGNGFFAQRLHVKRNAPLPLDLPHALIENAVQHHPAQTHLQFCRIKIGVPQAFRHMVVVQHANQAAAQMLDVTRTGIRRRLIHATGGRKIQITEVGFFARSSGWPRNLQS